MLNMKHFADPAGSHTSLLDLTVGYRVSGKTRYFSYNCFLTGEDDKAIFSIPGNTVLYCSYVMSQFRSINSDYDVE